MFDRVIVDQVNIVIGLENSVDKSGLYQSKYYYIL